MINQIFMGSHLSEGHAQSLYHSKLKLFLLVKELYESFLKIKFYIGLINSLTHKI